MLKCCPYLLSYSLSELSNPAMLGIREKKKEKEKIPAMLFLAISHFALKHALVCYRTCHGYVGMYPIKSYPLLSSSTYFMSFPIQMLQGRGGKKKKGRAILLIQDIDRTLKSVFRSIYFYWLTLYKK